VWSKPKGFEKDVGHESHSLPRGVLKDAVDCVVIAGCYSRSGFVRSEDCSRYPARLSMIASGDCILVCDLMRRELGRCLMCCLIERAMIALEILIEAEKPNPRRENLATLAPLRRKYRRRSICYAIDAMALLCSASRPVRVLDCMNKFEVGLACFEHI
jgi:hypothetical protein